MNRRHFVSATAGAGIALAQSTDRVATAMIGIGGRGYGLLEGIVQTPEARVAMLCDINAGRLDKAASAAAKDNPSTVTDWRRIIDRKDIGAVYIATPPHLHAEMAIAALASGKHVYCEKPIGVTAAQVKAIVAAARKSKAVFCAGQQLRSMTLLSEAIGKVHAGIAGDILMVKAQRHATSDLPHDSLSAEWYFDVAKSGGYLIEQSVHNLDLCNWVLKAHPTRAAGFGATMLHKDDPPGRTIFDCGSLTFDYPGGIKMSFTQNVFHPRGMPNGGQSVYLFGSKGAVDLMYGVTLYPHERDAMPVVLAEKRTENPHAHTAAFYQAILKGTPSPADITVGATAALTAILGHEAMVKQTVVNWTELGVEV